MIYIPMTCNILTPGHLKCLYWLGEKNEPIVVGLLTKQALKGYKKEVMSFNDRKFILESFGVMVTPQTSLDPSKNLKHYKPKFIASGDGFEKVEIEAAKKYGVKLLHIALPKKYSSRKYERGINS